MLLFLRSVELLKEELNVMERHLREANQKAEEVLLEVCYRLMNQISLLQQVSTCTGHPKS